MWKIYYESRDIISNTTVNQRVGRSDDLQLTFCVWHIHHINNNSFSLKTTEADQWLKSMNIIIVNVTIIAINIISGSSRSSFWEQL